MGLQTVFRDGGVQYLATLAACCGRPLTVFVSAPPHPDLRRGLHRALHLHADFAHPGAKLGAASAAIIGAPAFIARWARNTCKPGWLA